MDWFDKVGFTKLTVDEEYVQIINGKKVYLNSYWYDEKGGFHPFEWHCSIHLDKNTTLVGVDPKKEKAYLNAMNKYQSWLEKKRNNLNVQINAVEEKLNMASQ